MEGADLAIAALSLERFAPPLQAGVPRANIGWRTVDVHSAASSRYYEAGVATEVAFQVDRCGTAFAEGRIRIAAHTLSLNCFQRGKELRVCMCLSKPGPTLEIRRFPRPSLCQIPNRRK